MGYSLHQDELFCISSAGQAGCLLKYWGIFFGNCLLTLVQVYARIRFTAYDCIRIPTPCQYPEKAHLENVLLPCEMSPNWRKSRRVRCRG